MQHMFAPLPSRVSRGRAKDVFNEALVVFINAKTYRIELLHTAKGLVTPGKRMRNARETDKKSAEYGFTLIIR